MWDLVSIGFRIKAHKIFIVKILLLYLHPTTTHPLSHTLTEVQQLQIRTANSIARTQFVQIHRNNELIWVDFLKILSVAN